MLRLDDTRAHATWTTVSAFTVLCLVPAGLSAQETIRLGSELEGYVRTLQLVGVASRLPLTFRSLSAYGAADVRTDSSFHPWGGRYAFPPMEGAARDGDAMPPAGTASGARGRLHPVELRLRYNSDYPRAVNEGALWAGVGMTTALSLGGELAWGPVTATFLPTVQHAANGSFQTAPVSFSDRSSLAYPWHQNIDLPQRFGTSSFTTFDWGQSGLRIDVGSFTAGVSTENVWLGPAFRNGIIMSNAGPGMVHGDLGTRRPVSIGVGTLEVRWMVGRLGESDYFDSDEGNDGRTLTGLALNYRPRWLPGVDVGAQRVLYERSSDFALSHLLNVLGTFFREATVLPDGTKVNDTADQLVSAHVRWAFSEVGFETYLEWSRNDFSGGLRDFVLEPDHSSGYTIGFHQALRRARGIFQLRGELTHLGRMLPIEVRGSPTYYLHSIATQGYTNRGRPVGAWIGPGSNGAFFGLDWFGAGGRIGGFIERVRYDDDAYFRLFGAQNTRWGHDVEVTTGLSVLRFLGPVDLTASLEMSRRLNRNFEIDKDVTNVALGLTGVWRAP